MFAVDVDGELIQTGIGGVKSPERMARRIEMGKCTKSIKIR